MEIKCEKVTCPLHKEGKGICLYSIVEVEDYADLGVKYALVYRYKKAVLQENGVWILANNYKDSAGEKFGKNLLVLDYSDTIQDLDKPCNKYNPGRLRNLIEN